MKMKSWASVKRIGKDMRMFERFYISSLWLHGMKDRKMAADFARQIRMHAILRERVHS